MKWFPILVVVPTCWWCFLTYYSLSLCQYHFSFVYRYNWIFGIATTIEVFSICMYVLTCYCFLTYFTLLSYQYLFSFYTGIIDILGALLLYKSFLPTCTDILPAFILSATFNFTAVFLYFHASLWLNFQIYFFFLFYNHTYKYEENNCRLTCFLFFFLEFKKYINVDLLNNSFFIYFVCQLKMFCCVKYISTAF